jgi:hypothetical protein
VHFDPLVRAFERGVSRRLRGDRRGGKKERDENTRSSHFHQ